MTLMLVVANLANTKCSKKLEKIIKPWHIGTHMRVLSESFPMDTIMTGVRWFLENFVFVHWAKEASALKGCDNATVGHSTIHL